MSAAYGVPDADGVVRFDPATLRRIPVRKHGRKPSARAIAIAERKVLGLMIQALIERMDAIDGDPDLEFGDNEGLPSGGGPGDADDAEDNGDAEPIDEREPCELWEV